MTAKKETFTDVISAMLKAQGTVCAICEAPDRVNIEEAHRVGAPFSLIAQALQKLEVIDPNVTQDTASKRVRTHFTHHLGKE